MNPFIEGLIEYFKFLRSILNKIKIFYKSNKFIEFIYQFSFYSLAVSLILTGSKHPNIDYNRMFVIILLQISLRLAYLTYHLKITINGKLFK